MQIGGGRSPVKAVGRHMRKARLTSLLSKKPGRQDAREGTLPTHEAPPIASLPRKHGRPDASSALFIRRFIRNSVEKAPA
jgi:hypothetical protein